MGRLTYVNAVLADSPIAFWQGQDASGLPVDSVGGLNMGSCTGTYQVPGPMNDYAIRHLGGQGCSRANVSTETTTLTMEIIAKAEAISSTNQTLFYEGNSGSNGYGLIVGTVGSDFNLKPLLGGVTIGGNGGLSMTGGYDHIVFRRAADNNWTQWVNNAATNTIGTTSPIAPSGGGTIIGGSVSFQFSWAYAAFYSTDLSDARIAAHFNAITAQDQQQVLAMQTRIAGHSVF